MSDRRRPRRRPRPTLALAATAAALALAAPRTAAAQARCAAGTLAEYLDPAFACRLGGVTFSGFALLFFPDPERNVGVSTLEIDPALVGITPVRDASGVGFGFSGLSLAMTAAPGPGPVDGAAALALGFEFSGATVRSARVDASLLVDAPGLPGARLAGAAAVSSFVFGPGGACLEDEDVLEGPGERRLTRVGACRPVRPSEGLALYVLETELARGDATGTLGGGAAATLGQVTLDTVPEPTTVTLTGAGLLALLGAARRRRRAA